MADHIYKRIEIIGSSEKSIEDAIRNAIGVRPYEIPIRPDRLLALLKGRTDA